MPEEESTQEIVVSLFNTIKETLPSAVTSLNGSITMVQGMIDNKNNLVDLIHTHLGGNPSIADMVQKQRDFHKFDIALIQQLEFSVKFLGLLEQFFSQAKFSV